MKKIILLILLIGAIGAYGFAVKKNILPNTLNISFLNPTEDFPFHLSDDGEMMVGKPVIYLYPQETINVEVKLDFKGELIATYPNYNNGWSVTAQPDGTLTNHADGREYSYLFWEGVPNPEISWDLSTGFVVRGEDTISFLQEKLAKLGLTPREYNEFIVYWYPLMKNNPYNLIHFAGKEYTDVASLTITPTPESLLRVFMVYKPLTEKIEIPEQSLSSFERKGFSVIEWGGTEVK